MYRIFDLAVSSAVPLDSLARSSSRSAEIVVEMDRSAGSDEADWQWIHEWTNPGGELAFCCAAREGDYLLRFPGISDFRIDCGKSRITTMPLAGAALPTLARLLVDQVIPRMLFHRGRLVLHASAVTLPEGGSIAFLGCSGRGKSTLAASFFRAGADLITDDCLLLERGRTGVRGIPAYPSLRLWPDSGAALQGLSQGSGATTLDSGKVRINLPGTGGTVPSPPFSALFVLEEPRVGAGDDVEIRPLNGQKAMMMMIESAFVLDLHGKEAVRRNFLMVSELAQWGLPVFSLAYPRRYECLPAVHEAVITRLAACTR